MRTRNSESEDLVSAFIDDELNRDEANFLMARLAVDHTSRETVGRYQLIRAGVRGEVIDLGACAIADQVRERLVEEPTVLAPRQHASAKLNLRRGAVGVAIAASVAVLAIALLPRQAPEDIASEVSVAEAPGFDRSKPAVDTPMQLGAPPFAAVAANHRHLNSLIADHNEFVVRGGASGLMPYATFVSHNGR